MLDVFIFTYIEMQFTGKEKAFCVLEYAQSQSNKTVQHSFEREFSKQSPTDVAQKFKDKGCLCWRKGSEQPKTSGEMVDLVSKKS